MRNVKELLKNNKKVWFYLGENQDPKDLFAKEMMELGFTFTNGDPITNDKIGRIMSVHDDGRIAYVSLMVWTAAFNDYQGNFKNIPKINYMKYINDDPDYLMTKPLYQPIG